jgi:hypothetical protein
MRAYNYTIELKSIFKKAICNYTLYVLKIAVLVLGNFFFSLRKKNKYKRIIRNLAYKLL